jgi:hypothetical protein
MNRQRNPRTLLIDDERTLEVSKIARTFEEGMAQLRRNIWDILYLDHDLGDVDPGKTGYDILCWLEDPRNSYNRPRQIVLVTANPVGRQKMQVILNKLYPVKSAKYA